MRVQKNTWLAFAALLSAGISAHATSMTTVDFTFDTQTINSTVITGLSAGATASQIAAYMTAVLVASGCTGCSVVVPTTNSGNGVSQGAVADQTYNGEGYVTGPGNGGTSLTLGDSTGATASNTNSTLNTNGQGHVVYDTFVANTDDSSNQVSNQITFQFEGFAGDNITVNSFDYEIFPCQNGYENCTNPPDMTFEAGNNTNGVDTKVSTFGTNGVQSGVTPGTTDGNAVKSPNSSDTTADQYIGVWNSGITLTGNSELDFIDWPATIGVDNLSISYGPTPPGNSPSPVPEPATVALFGTVVVLLTKKLRRV